MNVATSSVLDMSDLLTRVDDDRELLVELFFIFKSLYPVHLERLREAVKLQDARKVEIESHSLKGMLLNLSALRAAAAVTELEQMGRAQKLEGMNEALAGFEVEAGALLTHMDQFASEFQP